MPRSPFRRRVSSCLAAMIVVVLGSDLSAQDNDKPEWPQWRGPDRDGISKETGWSVEGKAESLWKTNVGMGYSTVSIQDGRLYTMGHDKDQQEDTVFCLDAVTGAEIWKHSFPAKTWAQAHRGGTLSTPSADGKVVFAANREGNFFCFDAKSGKIRWQKQLKKDYGLRYPTWMFAASPLVFEDMVVMNVGVVLAFSKGGKLRWKSARSYGDSYSTPAEFEFQGRSCLAVFSSDGLAILDRKRGKELLFQEWKTPNDVNAATPVVIDDRVFISSGYNRGCAMVKLLRGKTEVLWAGKMMRNHMSGCVLWQDHLYGFDESTLKCLDLEGEEVWRQRGLGKGCMSLADGKILALSGKGELVIAEASSEGYQELSRAKVLRGGVYWTTPVLVDGLIYCRNSQGDLVCRDHRAGGQ